MYLRILNLIRVSSVNLHSLLLKGTLLDPAHVLGPNVLARGSNDNNNKIKKWTDSNLAHCKCHTKFQEWCTVGVVTTTHKGDPANMQFMWNESCQWPAKFQRQWQKLSSACSPLCFKARLNFMKHDFFSDCSRLIMKAQTVGPINSQGLTHSMWESVCHTKAVSRQQPGLSPWNPWHPVLR